MSNESLLFVVVLDSQFRQQPDPYYSGVVGETVTLQCQPPKGTPEPQVNRDIASYIASVCLLCKVIHVSTSALALRTSEFLYTSLTCCLGAMGKEWSYLGYR